MHDALPSLHNDSLSSITPLFSLNRPLTAPTPIWEGQPFLASSPKVKEVSFRVTAQGTMHAVVYWFCCHMGDGCVYISVGVGVGWMWMGASLDG